MTAQRAMELMRNLHYCLCWVEEMALHLIEEPSPEQTKILATFGHELTRGVLEATKS